MTGTSLLLPDAVITQADVLASLWTPEGVAPLLVSEFVLGANQASSLVNHAAPAAALSGLVGGVASAAITAPGSGGTDGAGQALAFSGGGGTGAAGTFTVSGGAVTAIAITSPGAHYTSAPTVSFAASAGLTGATASLTMLQPTYNPHSAIVATSAAYGPYGIRTGLLASAPDQTFVAVTKVPSNGSGFIVAGAGFIGISHGIVASKFGFYNGLSGTSPAVPHVSPTTTSNYNFVIGWGSAGSVGHIRVGAAGALGATVDGTSNGGGGGSAAIDIGADINSGLRVEIAYYARIQAILTDAQQLAWYLALKNGPLGQLITIA